MFDLAKRTLDRWLEGPALLKNSSDFSRCWVVHSSSSSERHTSKAITWNCRGSSWPSSARGVEAQAGFLFSMMFELMFDSSSPFPSSFLPN